jgi:hypothetical protein
VRDGALDDPLQRNFQWFSFVGGDDMYFGNDRLGLVRDAVLRRLALQRGVAAPSSS